MALTKIEKLVAKACLDYALLSEGDKILLGVSGGKDSAVLAWALSRRRLWQAPRFELEAVRIVSDLPNHTYSKELERRLHAFYADLGIPYREITIPVIGRVKNGETMNCYWCATQRRTELIRVAMAEGFTKLALGHHLDDILVTLLMNMVKKGELATMPPRLRYDKYPLELIRPLALVEEASIMGFVADRSWPLVSCSCPYGDDRERDEFQRRLEIVTGGSSSAKRNLFTALTRIKNNYLP